MSMIYIIASFSLALLIEVWIRLFELSKTHKLGSWLTMPVSMLICGMSAITALFVRDVFDENAYLHDDPFALFQFTALYLLSVATYASLFIKIFQKIFTIALVYFSISIAIFFVLQETYSALAYLLYALFTFFWYIVP